MAASITTAFTVVEPTSMPMRKLFVHVSWRPLRWLICVRDVVHEIRRQSDHALGVRHVVQRPLRFRMRLHPGAALVQRQAGLLQRFGEFLLRLVLRLAERHLHAASAR